MTVPWTERDHAALARELGAARAAAEGAALQRLAELVGVVFRLRDADGCPWDRKQTLASMSRHLAEETAETADAVAGSDDAHVCEELGDVLMNVLIMARIGADEQRFDLGAVCAGIAEKLVRRHPHVFGDVSAEDADAALASWNASKAAERGARDSVLDGVSGHLPSLLAALELGHAAATTGFDWPDAAGALDKLREEVAELEEAVGMLHGGGAGVPSEAASGDTADTAAQAELAARRAHLLHELGDVLFSVVNVARKTAIDPELALRAANRRFRARFAAVEQALGERLGEAPLDELERLWRQAARAETTSDPDAPSDRRTDSAGG